MKKGLFFYYLLNGAIFRQAFVTNTNKKVVGMSDTDQPTSCNVSYSGLLHF